MIHANKLASHDRLAECRVMNTLSQRLEVGIKRTHDDSLVTAVKKVKANEVPAVEGQHHALLCASKGQ